ncbi:FkbM family methyltransferase [Opitutaceae bacterium TAV4]|nr:FkbM family methyltransferase [Opitutaceae bacterium TAV4]RRJ99115.1 FkbM family methyltransferase [Opitutaceae bacterium TAV3]RRK00490.1 FkbM family methyltransferase [Opitutaceae bacterium TAV3]
MRSIVKTDHYRQIAATNGPIGKRHYKGLQILANGSIHEFVADNLLKTLPQGATILELGAGTGALSLRLADLGFNIVAVDYVAENFKAIHPNIRFYQADLNQDLSSSEHNQYDAVVAVEIIEHVENTRHLIRLINSALKDKGKCIITTPNITSPKSIVTFIVQGRFDLFLPRHYSKDGHINPVPWFIMEDALNEQNIFKDIQICGYKSGVCSLKGFIGSILQIFSTARYPKHKTLVATATKDIDCKPSWGTLRMPQGTWLLRLLIKVGLSRGMIRRWIRHHWKMKIKAGKYPAQVDACVRGIRFRLDFVRNTTDRQLLTCSNHYDGKELRVLAAIVKRGGAGGVFVDVGANTGYYSLSMAKAGYTRVLAIEPNPPTLQLLRFNVEANTLGNVIEIVPMCVGPGGKVPFHCGNAGDLGSASLLSENGDAETNASVMVESLPLLDILKSRRVQRIDGMKIDIEGYEDRALGPFFDAAQRSLWPKILVMEHCNRKLWEHDVITHILLLGYRQKAKARGNIIFELPI